MANLVRNYSPIQPNVQTAPSTVELNKVLLESARVMLMRYLRLVRDARRDNGQFASEAELIKWQVCVIFFFAFDRSNCSPLCLEPLKNPAHHTVSNLFPDCGYCVP